LELGTGSGWQRSERDTNDKSEKQRSDARAF
jgi:hypothetical protein